MRIYFVGSSPKESSAEEKERYKRACHEIGKYFASLGHEFVIGSISPGTADYYIAEGIKTFKKENSHARIHLDVITREDHAIQGTELESVLPKDTFVLRTITVPGTNNHARLISGLEHSDVVLLLGGGSGTLTTGIAALAMKRPTLALPQFGGAAKQIWDILVEHYARGPFSHQDIQRLQAIWSEESPRHIGLALKKIWRNNPFSQRIELNQALLAALSLVFTFAWIAVFTASKHSPSMVASAFFLLTGLAAALGSTTRNIVRCYFDLEERFSFGRFITEFVLGLVVVFILFLVFQLGGVVVSGKTLSFEDMTDSAQFQRVVVGMSLVGFAASYLIENSLERLRSRLTTVLNETIQSPNM